MGSLIFSSINLLVETDPSAIFDLLHAGAKEIHVTGFSFYMDSFMEGYKKGCDRDEEKFAEEREEEFVKRLEELISRLEKNQKKSKSLDEKILSSLKKLNHD